MLEVQINSFYRTRTEQKPCVVEVDCDCGDEPIRIIDPGRGEWKLATSEGYVYTFVGFNGENTVTIHMMTMQDGSWNVVGVGSTVDSPITVRTLSGREGGSLNQMTSAVRSIFDELVNRY